MPTVTNTQPLIRSEILVAAEDGTTLAETVELSLLDFEEHTLQESVVLEKVLDAATFERVRNAEVTVDEVFQSPTLLRAMLYAKIRNSIKDTRIRSQMSIEDFDFSLNDIASLSAD